MAVKITSLREAVKDNGLKALVHGLAGAGKTVLCATTGAPTLILSVEGGLLSIIDAPDYIHTVSVKTLAEFEEVYAMLKNAVIAGEREYEWIALDSISDIAETVLANELEKSPDPRKAYPAMQAEITKLIKGFRDLPHYHVIMTAKQDIRKDEYTGISLRMPFMPGTKLGSQIPYLFDEVFALRVEKDENGDDYRVLQTNRDIMYEAKDRSGKLNMFERPSLKRILQKIHGEVVQGDAMPTPTVAATSPAAGNLAAESEGTDEAGPSGLSGDTDE
jgi:hypothetical protein